ncbi:LysR family transcriptional regulator [Mesorhizobium sp. BH1-1-4]|uniref:LysR family transcriptional regulator n=1 Tax=Mesorhizobium sp. BH1-1-4 TaxID=2876662 RepID=UPI001CD0C311|nr:LysR family transcriptional regulator [Mesorhizobium sp. BH1-1-4]MBZ9996320.1 LysR family transcriptional regulator [Mesorhizobium sp. BH1-1-4]
MDKWRDNQDNSACRITKFGIIVQSSLMDLNAVLMVARRGKFRTAALELGVSTTALSNAVGKLERTLGVRLFNRTTRSVSLTEAGQRFVAQVAPAVQDIHEAMEVARSQQATPSGTLRINAFPTAAREIFSWLVLPFLCVHPQVHIDIVTEGRLVDIVAGGFDLGVRSSDLVPADMIALPLGVARRNVVVGAPSYLKAHGTPLIPQDLAEHSCLRVRLPDGAIYRWPFEKDGQSVHIDVEGPVTLDEASLARTAALASVGLTLAMEFDVRDDIEAGRLVRVLEDWTPTLSPLSLYYPSRRNPTAAFKAFVDFARRQSGASNTLKPSIGWEAP